MKESPQRTPSSSISRARPFDVGVAPRIKSLPKRGGIGCLGGVSLTALLLLLPTAGAGWPGVILKAPYSGTGFTLGSLSHSGPGCSNTHNFVAKQSHFNATTG